MISPSNAFSPEIISSGLNITVTSGMFMFNGTPTLVPQTIVNLSANATSYVFLNVQSGLIQANTTGFSNGNYPIAKVVTTATGISSLTDQRSDVPGVGNLGSTTTPILFSSGSSPVSFANECATLVESSGGGGNYTGTPILQTMDSAGVVHDVLCRVTSGAFSSHIGTIVFPYPANFGNGIPVQGSAGVFEIASSVNDPTIVLTNSSGTGSRRMAINFRGCNGPAVGQGCGTDLQFVEDPDGVGREEYLFKLIGGNNPLYFGNNIGTALLPGIALGGSDARTGPVIYIQRNSGGNDHIGRTAGSNGNTDTWGTKTLAAGTATVTFTPSWTSAPVCWCNNPNATPTACSASATNTTLTLKSGSGTDTVNYLCLGNPI